MDDKSLPTCFLSYCWANKEIADSIDSNFISIGFNLTRDVRDMQYRGSIKDFMNQVGKHDFVIMVISDAYLQSLNCMYEVMELLNSHEFEQRILPVILPDASGIFNLNVRLKYYQYWNDQIEQAKKRFADIPNTDHLAQLKHCQNISLHLDSFFAKITSIYLISYEELHKLHYEPILKILGIQRPDLAKEVLEIHNIKDLEEQELKLESFLKQHPENRSGLYLKAYLAYQREDYKRAKAFYQDIIKFYPKHSGAHHHLGHMLSRKFGQFIDAEKHLLIAVELTPLNENIHFDLGVLYFDMGNYAEARNRYEIAIKLNPSYTEAYYNLATFLSDRTREYDLSQKYYEKAIEIDSTFGIAHYGLGLLFERHLKNYVSARKHYEKAIEIDSKDADAHNNLSILLYRYFDDIEGAKMHYVEATEINPSYINQEADRIFDIPLTNL